MMKRGIRNAGVAAVVALVITLPLMAGAQAFPTKPMRLIIPFAPSGSTDIAGRLIAADMEKTLG